MDYFGAISNLIVFVGIVALLLVGSGMGTLLTSKPYQEKLNTCAKQNNVYECELIVVPKKGDY